MENKEFTYQGKTLNGILMLVLNIIGFLAGVGLFIFACVSQEGWLANVCWCLWRTASHPEHHLRLWFHPGGAGSGSRIAFLR